METKNTTTNVVYEVSDKVVADVLKKRGERIDRQQELSIDLSSLSKKIRRKFIDEFGTDEKIDVLEFRVNSDGEIIKRAVFLVCDNFLKSAEDVLEIVYQAKNALKNEARKQNQRNRKIKAVEEEQRKASALEREKEDREKQTWILEHGSIYLKKAFERGYSCTKQYVQERVGVEFASINTRKTVDFNDKAVYITRSCPSVDALALEDKLRALGYASKTMWLKTYDKHEPYVECDEHEVVIVPKYLNNDVIFEVP